MDSRYFKLEGKEALIAQLNQVAPDVEKGVEEALLAVGTETRDQLRGALPTGDGTPSAPGEAPRSQTGHLRRGIYAKIEPKHLGHEILLTVGVSIKSFYGFILEYGASKYAPGFKRKHRAGEGLKNQSKFGARLLPRPWYWPTVEKFWASAPEKVEAAVDKALKKYAS